MGICVCVCVCAPNTGITLLSTIVEVITERGGLLRLAVLSLPPPPLSLSLFSFSLSVTHPTHNPHSLSVNPLSLSFSLDTHTRPYALVRNTLRCCTIGLKRNGGRQTPSDVPFDIIPKVKSAKHAWHARISRNVWKGDQESTTEQLFENESIKNIDQSQNRKVRSTKCKTTETFCAVYRQVCDGLKSSKTLSCRTPRIFLPYLVKNLLH